MIMVELNYARKTAANENLAVTLTKMEFALLDSLYKNSGTILSSTQLADQNICKSAEAVRQRIRTLRRKLSFIGAEDLVSTVANTGYTISQNRSILPCS